MSSSAPQIFQDNDSKFGTLVAMKKPRLLEYLGSIFGTSQLSQRFWCHQMIIMIIDYDYGCEFFPNDSDKPRSTHLFFFLGGCPRSWLAPRSNSTVSIQMGRTVRDLQCMMWPATDKSGFTGLPPCFTPKKCENFKVRFWGRISFLVRNCNVWIILDVENNVEIETIQGLGFAVCECKLWGAQ